MSFSIFFRWVAKSKSGLQQLKDAARFTNMLLPQVQDILKKYLKPKKINAQWIPHLLTN